MPAPKKLGQQTVAYANPPVIVATASVVGPKEGEGPLGHTFDLVIEDSYFGEESWEKAERKMLEQAVNLVLSKAQLKPQDVDYFWAGDLLNQIISANYVARTLAIPFFGLYGARSTIYEGLALGGYAHRRGVCPPCGGGQQQPLQRSGKAVPVSHRARGPAPPTSQWTVTGAAAVLLAPAGNGPRITHATVGKVVDMGLKDPNDMGSAMAPAAADSIARHFQDTGRGPQDYDLILTGDLGRYGSEAAIRLLEGQNYMVRPKFSDCGVLIYDHERQDTLAGGSGCACPAVVLTSYLMGKLNEGTYRRVLALGTGALLSPTALQQGESIPAIGHGVVIEKL